MRARVIQVKELLPLPWFRKQIEHTLQNAEGVWGGERQHKKHEEKIFKI